MCDGHGRPLQVCIELHRVAEPLSSVLVYWRYLFVYEEMVWLYFIISYCIQYYIKIDLMVFYVF